jgi:signal transduction histidine kinase
MPTTSNRFYFPLFIFAIIVFGSLISWYVYQGAKADATDSLIARTDTIAQLVSETDLSSLTYSEADLNSSVYQNLKQSFINARGVNKDVRFVYVFVVDDNKVKFVLDSESEESEDYSPPGEEYMEANEQPEIYEAFRTGKSVVQKAYSDRWGTWITGLSPIKDKNGVTKYILGIDVAASDFILRPYIEAAFPALLSLLLVVFAIAMYLVRRKELELVKTKAQFVSIASHELRSPLTGIRWSAENILKDGQISESVKKQVESMHDSSLHLLAIINDLLSISLTERDFVNSKTFTDLDIKPIILSAMSDLKVVASSGGVKLVADISEEALMIRGSAERVKNIFFNLISNAIKYSKNGSEIFVSAQTRKTPKGKFVYFSVRDTGIGIPKDDINKVYGGFYRAPNAKLHTATGTGLGLYMCDKIAKLHGGRLDIKSEEGKGSTISVSFPFTNK